MMVDRRKSSYLNWLLLDATEATKAQRDLCAVTLSNAEFVSFSLSLRPLLAFFLPFSTMNSLLPAANGDKTQSSFPCQEWFAVLLQEWQIYCSPFESKGKKSNPACFFVMAHTLSSGPN